LKPKTCGGQDEVFWNVVLAMVMSVGKTIPQELKI